MLIMSYFLSAVEVLAGAFIVCNIGEYCMRRYSLGKDVRGGMSPDRALADYNSTVDELYRNLGFVSKLLSPSINLATEHFKRVHRPV